MHIEHFVGLNSSDVVWGVFFSVFGYAVCFKEDAEKCFIFAMIAMRGQKAFVHDCADDVDVGIRKRAFTIFARDGFLNLEDDLFEFVEVHELSVAKKKIFSSRHYARNEVECAPPAFRASFNPRINPMPPRHAK